MRLEDAPPAGWYPDPAGGIRLRWWDGTDWTERYRSRPDHAEVALAQRPDVGIDPVTGRASVPSGPVARDMGNVSRADAERIISEVRQVARNEVNRAADMFSARASAAAREIPPLVSEYTSRLIRWIKILLVVVVVLAVAWVVFQLIAEVTFFEWLGDRIDNLTDET